MKKMIRFMPAVAAIMIMVAAVPAYAALKAQQVENFIASMGQVNTLAENVNFETDMDIHSNEEKFSPYSSGLKELKESDSGAYKDLGKIVKKHGFSSQEDWASVGDAVFLAYMAVKTEETNPDFAAEIQAFPPEMLASMPPEARAQFEITMKMVRAVAAVPAGDKAVVSPYMARIEQAISGAAQP